MRVSCNYNRNRHVSDIQHKMSTHILYTYVRNRINVQAYIQLCTQVSMWLHNRVLRACICIRFRLRVCSCIHCLRTYVCHHTLAWCVCVWVSHCRRTSRQCLFDERDTKRQGWGLFEDTNEQASVTTGRRGSGGGERANLVEKRPRHARR